MRTIKIDFSRLIAFGLWLYACKNFIALAATFDQQAVYFTTGVLTVLTALFTLMSSDL